MQNAATSSDDRTSPATSKPARTGLRAVREARRVSQLAIAAETRTSIGLVHLFEETDGRGVKHPQKRAALEQAYARLAAECEAAGVPGLAKA